MQRFDQWLEEKLEERGWQPADLARASKQPDYPRGFDPGLISRWRKPPPMGVVPMPPTLDRLALALRVPYAEVYAAAGRLLPAGHVAAQAGQIADDDPIDQAYRTVTAQMREALRNVPRPFWPTIIKATFDRAIDGARDMAELLTQRHSAEGTVSDQPVPAVSKSQSRPNKRPRDGGPNLLDVQHLHPALLGAL